MKHNSNKSKSSRQIAREKARVDVALSPRRRWWFRSIALVILPLALLVGFELVLRLGGYGYSTRFFEKYRANGKVYLVNNESVSLRFFPPQLARFPSPVMFELQKPTNTYRIFILGESAARGEPEPNYAASRYLEVLLDQRYPRTHFQVINLGITAIDSHVILPIARDCAKANGDLWIVYMGNNEMVGPFGAATVFGAKAPPLGFVRANLAIQQTRIGQLLVSLGSRLARKNTNSSWGGMKMFVGNQLRPDDPRKEVVYQNFERNVQDIVRVGMDSGVKILLNTVAVNLKDCPPFASLANSNLQAAVRSQFDQLYKDGRALESQTNFTEAAQKFTEAAKLDAGFAEMQYRWGHCLLGMSNLAAAREHLQKACDDDALPFRADSRVNGAIQKTAQRLAGEHLVFVDSAAEIETSLPWAVAGRETFFEHVHFNDDGNFRLGSLWAERVEKMLPASIAREARTNAWVGQEICEQLLGMTDWNRYGEVETMIERLHRPPFNGQSNNDERIEALRVAEAKLRQGMTPAGARQAADIYQMAIRQAPEDHFLHENFAEFLEAVGDLKAAVAQWQAVQKILPHSCEPFYKAGRLLSKLEQWTEAETALTEAVSLRPHLAEGWYELGGVHMAQKQFEAALRDYNRARQLDAQDANYCAFAGKALSKLGRSAEAIRLYREAIQLQPDLWKAHLALGDELSAAKQLAEAKSEYEQAIKSRPELAVAHLDLGVTLAQLGQTNGAIREFQEALRLEPSNQAARENLERVQAGRNQKR